MPERPITEAVLAEHDALRAAATPVPWRAQGIFGYYAIGPDDVPTAEGRSNGRHNIALITTLANDDAAMVATVRTQAARIEALEGTIRDALFQSRLGPLQGTQAHQALIRAVDPEHLTWCHICGYRHDEEGDRLCSGAHYSPERAALATEGGAGGAGGGVA